LLDAPVSLASLRKLEPAIQSAIKVKEREITGTLYRPFQLSDKQPLRATQHYLTKLPLSVIRAVPPLLAAAERAGNGAALDLAPPPTTQERPAASDFLGQDYVTADEESAYSRRDSFTVDPAVVDRGARGHAATQNALAALLKNRGAASAVPLTPSSRP
jgi:hypothetical protein